METVSVRFEKNVMKNIDESIRSNNFNSRTEFIREAVRDKLTELERQKLINKIMAHSGKYTSSTPEQRAKDKEEMSKKIFAEIEDKFK